ncbi:MAG: hypothetical protein KUG74_11740 [Rhodobacteraceae bacterium]|nr:hypothetical protein [Paracoccaceae bacterium]
MSSETSSFLERDQQAQRKRKTREAAAFLPILGVILLLTPMISVFTQDTRTGGIPNAVFYVFGVWLLLIGLTFLIAPRLQQDDKD